MCVVNEHDRLAPRRALAQDGERGGDRAGARIGGQQVRERPERQRAGGLGRDHPLDGDAPAASRAASAASRDLPTPAEPASTQPCPASASVAAASSSSRPMSGGSRPNGLSVFGAGNGRWPSW